MWLDKSFIKSSLKRGWTWNLAETFDWGCYKRARLPPSCSTKDHHHPHHPCNVAYVFSCYTATAANEPLGEKQFAFSRQSLAFKTAIKSRRFPTKPNFVESFAWKKKYNWNQISESSDTNGMRKLNVQFISELSERTEFSWAKSLTRSLRAGHDTKIHRRPHSHDRWSFWDKEYISEYGMLAAGVEILTAHYPLYDPGYAINQDAV